MMCQLIVAYGGVNLLEYSHSRHAALVGTRGPYTISSMSGPVSATGSFLAGCRWRRQDLVLSLFIGACRQYGAAAHLLLLFSATVQCRLLGHPRRHKKTC